VTGVECLGILPTVEGKRPDPNLPGDPAGRILAKELGTARFVVEQPFSRFSEGVRAIKVAADVAGLTRQSKTIGVVSALPHEGKTTVSSNLAQLIAHSGGRVLLVDSDLRNPSLTRTLAPTAEKGLIDILGKKATLQEVIWTDPVTGVHFVPAVLPTRIAHTSELVSSEAMRSFLAAAQDAYEYVVVDLPPIAPVVDVKAASYLIDSFVLVIEWGQTAREAVVEALNSAPGVSDKLLGAVLNKANPAVLKRLEAYKGRYYRSYYNQYGYSSS
jgi:succinoglycan biosynthesis transport protein ExoP